MSAHKFMTVFHKVGKEMESQHAAWVKNLRASGFKAAHPNDGWVDRKKNELKFAYPHFNDGAAVGDLVMLGYAHQPDTMNAIRLVGRRKSAFFPVARILEV